MVQVKKYAELGGLEMSPDDQRKVILYLLVSIFPSIKWR